jgi:GYF domain 2
VRQFTRTNIVTRSFPAFCVSFLSSLKAYEQPKTNDCVIRVSDAIYIFHDGKQEGPFTGRQVEAMWTAASVSNVSLAWTEGMPEWAPLNTILPPFPEQEPTPAPPLNDPSDCNAVDHGQGEAKALPHYRGRDARKEAESGAKFPAPSSKPDQGTQNRELNAKIEKPSANSSRTEETNGLSAKRYFLIQLCSAVGVELITIPLLGVLPHDVLVAGIIGGLATCILQMFLFLMWWFYFKKFSTEAEPQLRVTEKP